jgi:hypothetical protein
MIAIHIQINLKKSTFVKLVFQIGKKSAAFIFKSV